MSQSTWAGTDTDTAAATTIPKPQNMYLKIVHKGGLVELYDGPVPAIEIMNRNPRTVVTGPSIFHNPWAIVPPDTILMPGQKFYVVSTSTVRKLQRRSDPAGKLTSGDGPKPEKLNPDSDTAILMKLRSRSDYAGHDDDDENYCCDSCFAWLLSGKSRGLGDEGRKEMAVKSRSDKSNGSQSDPPKLRRSSSGNSWTPSLESISEEFPL